MAKKKLSDVNTVAQISDNDYITCIMSNGEVVKVKKSDLLTIIREGLSIDARNIVAKSHSMQPVAVNDFNTVSGNVFIRGLDGAKNGPTANALGLLGACFEWDSNTISMMCIDMVSNTMFIRRKVGGNWNAWARINAV